MVGGGGGGGGGVEGVAVVTKFLGSSAGLSSLHVM